MRKTRTPQIRRKLEIEYSYHPTPNHFRTHWMYCDVSGGNDTECKEAAKKYFEKQIRELGWGKITTLTEIRPLSTTNDPHRRKTNSDLSGARSTSSTSKGTSRKPRSTAKRSSTSATKTDPKSGEGAKDSPKPTRNRKTTTTAKPQTRTRRTSPKK